MQTGTFQPFRIEPGIFCWGFLWLPWESTKENPLPAAPGTFPGSPGPDDPLEPSVLPQGFHLGCGTSLTLPGPKSLFLCSVGTSQPLPLIPGHKHSRIQQLLSLPQARVHNVPTAGTSTRIISPFPHGKLQDSLPLEQFPCRSPPGCSAASFALLILWQPQQGSFPVNVAD